MCLVYTIFGQDTAKKDKHCCLSFLLVTRTGLSPLAARPAPPLSIAYFAVNFIVNRGYRRQSVLLSQNGSYPRAPHDIRLIPKKRTGKILFSFLVSLNQPKSNMLLLFIDRHYIIIFLFKFFFGFFRTKNPSLFSKRARKVTILKNTIFFKNLKF